MGVESVSELYHGVETSDAFDEPFAVWNVVEHTYYRQEDGTVPTFLSLNDAELYAKGLWFKKQLETEGVAEKVIIGMENVLKTLRVRNHESICNIKVLAASRSNYEGYNVFVACINGTSEQEQIAVYLGKQENYDNHGYYDNSDMSLEFISENRKMFSFLDNGRGWCASQQEMLDEGIFTEDDYCEYARLKSTTLSKYKEIREIKFSIDYKSMDDSGTPFRYPLESQKELHNSSNESQRIKRGR